MVAVGSLGTSLGRLTTSVLIPIIGEPTSKLPLLTPASNLDLSRLRRELSLGVGEAV